MNLFETQLRSRGLTEAGEAIGGHIGVLFRVERRRFVARVVDGQRRVGEFLGSDEPAALHLLEATKMFDFLFRWKDSLVNLIKLEFSHSIEQFHHCAPVGLIVHLAGLEDEQVAYLMALCVHSGLHFSITTFRSFPDSFNSRELSASRKWIVSSLNNELISFYQKSFGSEPV